MSNGAILIDDIDTKCCRICHHQDLDLESPCHCSGTLKFAHRDCIQRWCEEKGNTTCEICLQKFEPGYISPAKKLQLIHTTDTARNELETEENVEGERSRCAEYRRLLAILFTLVLLIKNLFDILSGEEAQAYPFSLLTVRSTSIPIFSPYCDNYQQNQTSTPPDFDSDKLSSSYEDEEQILDANDNA